MGTAGGQGWGQQGDRDGDTKACPAPTGSGAGCLHTSALPQALTQVAHKGTMFVQLLPE